MNERIKQMTQEEIHYKLLKMLEEKPDISQREISKILGVSLGKTNYCLKALVEMGLVKAGNFKNSQDRRGYAYFLTPEGVKAKAKATLTFLRKKQEEYELIKREIGELKQEISSQKSGRK